MKQYGTSQPLMMRRDYGSGDKGVEKDKESMMYKRIPIEDYDDTVPDSKTIIEIEDYDEGR